MWFFYALKNRLKTQFMPKIDTNKEHLSRYAVG